MRTLGPYLLTRRLGVGGMGEVWKGEREAAGGATKNVAVKTLLSQRAGSEKLREMFMGEARLSMQLTNSNIVQVFDVDETADGTCYMAMEWVDGLDLAELDDKLRELGETLPLHVSAFIVGEVLKGLAYAHEFEVDGERKTIVHRDISPHNVMLSVTGEVKLMDFGVARLATEETSGVHVKGKLRYMPPEQLGGETRSPGIDLFAAGAIFHELLSGKKFRGEVFDQGHLYGVVLGGQVESLEDPDSIPAELRELLASLLAAEPDKRPVSARQAYRQLTSWPGYRDAKFDLEDIVRRFARRPTNSPDGSATLPAVMSGSATVAASARDLPRVGGSETEAAPVPGSGRGRRLAMVGALVSVVVGGGVVGLGTTLGWWSSEEPEPRAEEPLVQQEAASQGPSAEEQEAKEVFGQATRAYEHGQYAEALELFQQGQALYPSPIYNFNIAKCHEELGRYEAAKASYEAYLVSYSKKFHRPPDDQEQVEATIARLESLLDPSVEEQDGPADESETGEGDETETGSEGGEAPDLDKPVRVTVAAPGEKRYAELKIGRKTFVLDMARQRTQARWLAPRRYGVKYRLSSVDPWQATTPSTIVVPAGRAVTVELRPGGEVKVK